MIPIGTAVPSRYPPIITWLLIATNCAVFLFQQSLSPAELNEFIEQFAFIPARYMDFFGYGDAEHDAADFLPFITMMFLHGGWLHLIFNMWTLWLFGPTIEDRLGHGRYFVFYFCCGIAASLAQLIIAPTSTVPVLAHPARLRACSDVTRVCFHSRASSFSCRFCSCRCFSRYPPWRLSGCGS
jgi:membrane associated rhomboid family serine protease